jgi:hypothetical protein
MFALLRPSVPQVSTVQQLQQLPSSLARLHFPQPEDLRDMMLKVGELGDEWVPVNIANIPEVSPAYLPALLATKYLPIPLLNALEQLPVPEGRFSFNTAALIQRRGRILSHQHFLMKQYLVQPLWTHSFTI